MTQNGIFICLGSNLGDSAANLREALQRIARAGVNVTVESSLYCTEPQNDPNQPWFYNQVARLDTALPPHELLQVLQGIENAMGRERGARRYGPRVIDLDILLYNNQVVQTETLIIPHPRMQERAFALVPLLEIVPEARMPDGAKIKDLLGLLNFSLTGDKIRQKL